MKNSYYNSEIIIVIGVCCTLKSLNNSSVQQSMSVIRDKVKSLDFRIKKNPDTMMSCKTFSALKSPNTCPKAISSNLSGQ